jgi:tetratricopeptide (TPR) repeat protein
MRSDFLYARMTVAMLEYEQAKLLRDNQEKYQEQMNAAQQEFGKISKEFRERLIGLEAIHYQGRCYQDLGELKTALDYYEQLLQLSELPDSLSNRTLAGVLECYVQLEQPQRAVTMGEKWLGRGGDRQQTSEAAEVSVSLGQAYIAAAQLESGRKQQRNLDEARTQLMRATRIPGPQQPQARALLATLPAVPAKLLDPSEMDDFATAKTAADQARDQMQSTQTLVELQRRKLQMTEDAERRAEAQAALDASEQNLKRFQVGALLLYRQALAMAGEDVSVEDLNEVRYMIAYMNYQLARYMEAAAVAEFVALRFPDAAPAKECANIAMACYWALYQQSTAEDKTFETQRMIRVSELIASRWAGAAEAEAALVNLVNLTVRQGDAAKAEEYLSRIPADSAARVSAELRTGAGLWRLWLKQSREAADGAAPDNAQLARAENLLSTALEKSRGQEADAVIVQAALALAQLQVETGRSTAALVLLRDEQIGPKALIDRGHASVSAEGFVEQTYRTLLKALISQLAEGQVSAEAVIRETTETMEALKQVVGDSAAGQKQLIATYVALAQDLRQQIETAAPQTQDKLRGGFVAFLDRVAESSDALSTRLWVADTYLGMADDIVAGASGALVPDDARQFYQNALDTFAKLINMPDDTPEMSPSIRTHLRLQMALANRRLGKHKEAIDLFEEVLKERNNIVNVQVEAAQTFQEAGEAGSNNLYELAIRGARPNAENANTIWGWQRLANVAAGQMKRGPEAEAKFSDLFFQSRYNIAQCRYLQARRSAGQQQTGYLQQATRTIKLTRSLYPEMGGKEWQARFTELAGKISALTGS